MLFRSVIVRITNELDANIGGFGTPCSSPHFHNMHTPHYSDGNPMNTIPCAANPGDPFPYRDHHYPMIYAGGDSRGGAALVACPQNLSAGASGTCAM